MRHVASHRDESNIGLGALDSRHQFPAVGICHEGIRENNLHVMMPVVKEFESGVDVACYEDSIAVALQEGLDKIAAAALLIYEEDGFPAPVCRAYQRLKSKFIGVIRLNHCRKMKDELRTHSLSAFHLEKAADALDDSPDSGQVGNAVIAIGRASPRGRTGVKYAVHQLGRDSYAGV